MVNYRIIGFYLGLHWFDRTEVLDIKLGIPPGVPSFW